MVDSNEREHITTDDTRAGTTPHMTRYILPVSLGLIIVIFGLYLIL